MRAFSVSLLVGLLLLLLLLTGRARALPALPEAFLLQAAETFLQSWKDDLTTLLPANVTERLHTALWEVAIGLEPTLVPAACELVNGTVLLDITTRAEALQVAALIEELQGEVVYVSTRFGTVRVRVPMFSLLPLVNLDGLLTVRCADQVAPTMPLPVPPPTNATNGVTVTVPSAVSDLVRVLDLNTLHTTYKITGAGISIGVLSSDVASLLDLQAAGLLPNVTVLSGQVAANGTGTGEGTAMLQIIHQIAPSASLFFASSNLGQGHMADSILALAEMGCRVIVDDVTYRDEPALHDQGPISAAISEVVAAGVIYLTSAGNTGNFPSGTSTVWEGPFAALSAASPLVHAFRSGEGLLAIMGDAQSVVLWWSDPLQHSSNDYNLFLMSGSGQLLQVSQNVQNGHQDPYELLDLSQLNLQNQVVYVAVKKASASVSDRYLRVSLFGGSNMKVVMGTAGSVFGHAALPDVISVAAMQIPAVGDAFSINSDMVRPESYSSDGPRRIFYNQAGVAFTADLLLGGQLRQQPFFTGLDGIKTNVTRFAAGFFGTSAAAPVIAGLAALVLQLDIAETLTAVKLIEMLAATALQIGSDAFAGVTGFGLPFILPLIETASNCTVGHYVNTTTIDCILCPPEAAVDALAFRFNATFGIDSCFATLQVNITDELHTIMATPTPAAWVL